MTTAESKSASTERRSLLVMALVLIVTAGAGAATLDFWPTFAFPHGDEATYISYARNPWTNISPFFEGFRPKEVQNPYNFRLLLAPMSLVLAWRGYDPAGIRVLQLAWGLLLLVFGYLVGRRMGSPVTAAAAMGVLAWSPYFVYFSHAVRPEGMFVMWTMLTAWVLVRRDAPGPRTWAAVAFLSSCHLWIHYDGVVMPVVFFIAAVAFDRRGVSWRKIGAYALGSVAFLLAYAALNILPAMDTIRELGVLPVTFLSTSRIPLFTADRLDLHAARVLDFYRGYAAHAVDDTIWWLDPNSTGRFTLALVPFAVAATLFRDARRERTLALVWVLTAAAMVFVIPNRRPEYAWYLVPIPFVLAARGLSRIPGWFGRGLAIAVLGGLLVVFGMSANREVRRFHRFIDANARTAGVLASLAESLDRPVRVMGGQEFRVVLPDVEWRTLHSMIETGSAAKTLELIRPDIVVHHERAVFLLAAARAAERPPATPDVAWLYRVNEEFMATLRASGYRQVNPEALKWDDQRVVLFIKDR